MKKELDYIAPCLKCDSNDISIGDCGYSTFNVGFGKCKSCKNEVIIQPLGYNPDKEIIIKEWNSKNDIDILIKQERITVNNSKEKIKQLKALKLKRKLTI